MLKNVLMDANEGLYIDLSDFFKRLQKVEEALEGEDRTYTVMSTCPIELNTSAKFLAWRACYYDNIEDEETKVWIHARTPYYAKFTLWMDTVEKVDEDGEILEDGLIQRSLAAGYVYNNSLNTDNGPILEGHDIDHPLVVKRYDTNFIIYTLEEPTTIKGISEENIKTVQGYSVTNKDWINPTKDIVISHVFPPKDDSNNTESSISYATDMFTSVGLKKIPLYACGCSSGTSNIYVTDENTEHLQFDITMVGCLYKGVIKDGAIDYDKGWDTTSVLAGFPTLNVGYVQNALIKYLSDESQGYSPGTKNVNRSIQWLGTDVNSEGIIDYIAAGDNPKALDHNVFYVYNYDDTTGTIKNKYYYDSNSDPIEITVKNNFHKENVALFAKNALGEMCFLCTVNVYPNLYGDKQDYVYICGATGTTGFRDRFNFTFDQDHHQYSNTKSAVNTYYTNGTFIRDPSADITDTLKGYLEVQGGGRGAPNGSISYNGSNYRTHFNIQTI